MANRSNGKRPNFLVIMSDEHGPMFSSTYGHPLVRTPNMDRLADRAATFNSAYCNSPLCVPSRLSFMTGRYASRVRAWDNATPLASDIITWPYLLRSVGYDVVLSGKMHFTGQDKLHGFRKQLAFDPHGDVERDSAEARQLGISSIGRHPIYPWREGIPAAFTQWPDVKHAGPGSTPMIKADDEIESAALRYLKESENQPFALCVGFVAPHFPFIVPENYFSQYWPDFTDLPEMPLGHIEDLPASARRLRRAFGYDGYTEHEIRRARAAYYGLVTYMDDKIGRLMDTLEEQGLADNTIIIYTSDHGESLGEHGLWRKMNFYEQSARVPLQISWPSEPSISGRRVENHVSLVDLTVTILDLAGVPVGGRSWEMDGDSLVPLMLGDACKWKDEVFVEHLAHGTDHAQAMLRSGPWKLCYGHSNPPEIELYNLESDPGEFLNLAHNPNFLEIREDIFRHMMQIWGDPLAVTQEVMLGQESRQLIRKVLGDVALF